jgi:hypothetical protein
VQHAVERVRELTGGEAADVVVDVTAVSVQSIVDAVERRRSHKDRLKLRYVLSPSNAVIAVNEALDAPRRHSGRTRDHREREYRPPKTHGWNRLTRQQRI